MKNDYYTLSSDMFRWTSSLHHMSGRSVSPWTRDTMCCVLVRLCTGYRMPSSSWMAVIQPSIASGLPRGDGTGQRRGTRVVDVGPGTGRTTVR